MSQARLRQKEIYSQGFAGRLPVIPTDFTTLENLAVAKLSKKAYAYIAGGAGKESTITRNLTAFLERPIVPRVLQAKTDIELRTKFLTSEFPAPFFLCPIGVLELVHPRGDLLVAEACRDTGTPMVVSSQASNSMEEISSVIEGSPWYFQLYISRSDELALHFVERAEKAGAKAIFITLDTTSLGWRPRDLNMAYLPFMEGKGIAQYTSDPIFRQIAASWPAEKSTAPINIRSITGLFKLAWKLPGSFYENIQGQALNMVRAFTQIYSRPDLDWAMIDKIKQNTDLPIVLKGILSPADARLAAEKGMDGIYVSNHGGRQIEGEISSLEALELIRKDLPDMGPILFDSGIRSGSDAFKAIASGAQLVGIGRPYAYALAVGGKQGVIECIRNIQAELELTMSLCGAHSIASINSTYLQMPI
jgi:lactate 2-monooxygenase